MVDDVTIKMKQNDFHNNDKMRNDSMLKGIEKPFNYFYLQKKIANMNELH